MFNHTPASDRKPSSLPAKPQADEKNNKTSLVKESAPLVLPVSVPENRYIFSQEEFGRIMSGTKSGSLLGRIQDVIMPNSIAENMARIFYLYWTETEHIHAIKISYTCDDDFYFAYSRFLNTDNFNQHFPGYRNPGYRARLKICTLRVEELGEYVATGGASIAGTNAQAKYAKKEDKQLLFMWFTLDGFLGELRTLQGTDFFSANDVMAIYQYFSEFLQLENTFICDTSMMHSQDMKISIPLRVIAPLATDKTWYQHHVNGVALIDGANLTIGHRTVHQFADKRREALTELQRLPLKVWHNLLDEVSKKVLVSLCKKVRVNYKQATLGVLASTVYDRTKHGSVMTEELQTLGVLLSGNEQINFDNIPLAAEDPAKVVKSNIHHLLWGSYLWRQEGIPKSLAVSFAPDTYNEGNKNECVNHRL